MKMATRMIDISNWKNFIVSDVLQVDQTKSIVAKADLKNGNIPYVSRTASNNGYQGYCGNEDKVNKGNCITIGAETAVAFYQPENFVAGNKVYRLSREGLKEKHYLFLAAMLNRKSNDYSYSNARIPAKIKTETIFLPARHKVNWGLLEDLIGGGTDMSSIDTSEWKEFKLCDLFEKISVERIKGKANDFPTEKEGKYCIPLLTAGANNQGLARYAKREDCPTTLKNVLSISANGANTGTTFYQDKEFAVLQDAYAIRLIGEEIPSKEIGAFLVTAINKSIKDNHDWSNKAGWNNIKNDKILLPVEKDEYVPDWAFMERYIAELEEERVAELDAYLTVCGLNDYELNDSEKAALCMSDEKYIEKFCGPVIWKKVHIKDLFDSMTGDFDIKKEHINNKGINVISSGLANRGIIGRSDVPAREIKSNTITVDMFGNVFYRDAPYKLVTHARVFSLLPKIEIDDKIGVYIEEKLKFLSSLFEYNNMCSFSKIKDIEIELPFDENGNLHKQYIYIYISALEKTVIKEVVLWKDRELEELKKIIA